jgi:hypothetical protein
MFISVKLAVFWDVAPCSPVNTDPRFRVIILMMEAVRSSETTVNIYHTTRRNILQTGIFIFVAVKTSNLTFITVFTRARWVRGYV